LQAQSAEIEQLKEVQTNDEELERKKAEHKALKVEINRYKDTMKTYAVRKENLDIWTLHIIFYRIPSEK